MSGLLKTLLPAIAVGVASSAATVWMIGRSAPPLAALEPASLALGAASDMALVAVTELPATARLRLGGYVEARSTVRLAAQAPGRVTYVAGQEGAQMAAGQIVVALDDDALTPEYRAAWSALAAESSSLQNAQVQLYNGLYGKPTSPLGGPGYDAYERMTVPLYNMAQSFFGQMMPGLGGGPGSPFGSTGPMMSQSQAQRSWPALNNARADYERRVSGMVEAQSRLDSLDARLRDRRSVAPQAGVIVHKFVRAGDVVQPGQPLVDLADVNALDFRIEVPVSQATVIRAGEAVPLSINGQNIWAQVAQVYPAADDAARTVSIKLALPDGFPAAPGMYGVAWLPQPGGGSPQALSPAIPESAIAYRGSLPVAFVRNASGAIEMRILRLGDAQDGKVAVLSGLSAGEQVVAKPSPSLKAATAEGAASAQ